MITKKVWNSFTEECRVKILETMYELDVKYMPQHIQKLTKPYNHNFNYDKSGEKLKELLNDLKLEKGGNLSITLSITPTWASVTK